MALLEPLSEPLARYHPANTVACTVQATACRERDPSARSRAAPALAAAPRTILEWLNLLPAVILVQFPRCTTYFSPALTTNRALASLVPDRSVSPRLIKLLLKCLSPRRLNCSWSGDFRLVPPTVPSAG